MYSASLANIVIVSNPSAVFEISDFYIGNGVYSSPLHDKSGNVIWTNNGLLPVEGVRGKALVGKGSQVAVAHSPVVGTTGTVAIKFSLSTAGVTSVFFSNYQSNTGFYISRDSDNTLDLWYGNGSAALNVKTSDLITDSLLHTLIVKLTATTVTFVLDGNIIKTATVTSMVSGTLNALLGLDLVGTIYNFKAWNRILSDDECISWMNDPAGVDSKSPYQLSIDFTGLPTYADKATANAASYYGAFKTSTGLLGYAG